MGATRPRPVGLMVGRRTSRGVVVEGFARGPVVDDAVGEIRRQWLPSDGGVVAGVVVVVVMAVV